MSNIPKALRLWPIGLVVLATVVIVAAQQPVTVVSGTIAGSKTNNAAAPSTNNLGVLGCIANASAPSWTEGDLVGCSVDLSGNQRLTIANPGATRTVNGTAAVAEVTPQYDPLVSGGTASMTGTTSTSVISAVTSSYLYITSCSVGNAHASVDTLVDLQDGSGGTTIWTFTAAHGYGGESHTFQVPLKVPTISHALYAADETTGAAVKIFCQGFASTVSW